MKSRTDALCTAKADAGRAGRRALRHDARKGAARSVTVPRRMSDLQGAL